MWQTLKFNGDPAVPTIQAVGTFPHTSHDGVLPTFSGS